MLARVYLLALLTCRTQAFSESSYSLFDRFNPSCPADASAVARFDKKLLDGDQDASVWAAVFRSNNNKPSVMVRDDFLSAMRSAVDVSTPPTGDDELKSSFVSADSGQSPVAVARLRPSTEFEGCWVLDSMRCILKKENTDDACDGGSEHTEALSAAIDALLLYHLNQTERFEGTIRTKATLVSGILLDERGFQEVQKLDKDMATHVSSLDACMERYAARSVTTESKSPGAQQRALSIVSLLGQIDRERDLRKAREQDSSGDDEAEYDPWASVNNQL